MDLSPDQEQIIKDVVCALGDDAGSVQLREITIACQKILAGDLEPAFENLKAALIAWWLEFESYMSINPPSLFGQFKPALRRRTRF